MDLIALLKTSDVAEASFTASSDMVMLGIMPCATEMLDDDQRIATYVAVGAAMLTAAARTAGVTVEKALAAYNEAQARTDRIIAAARMMDPAGLVN